MNILIVGQGAMGLLWYHQLSKLIDSFSISDTPEAQNIPTIHENIQLHLLPSNRHLTLAKTTHGNAEKTDEYIFTSHVGQISRGKIQYANEDDIHYADLILLCVKSFQTSSALLILADKLKANSRILLAHNGMGTLAELPLNIVNKHTIYTLLTTHGCLRTAPLTITHTGVGTTDIGLLSGRDNSAQQHALTHLLNAALPSVTYHQEIKQKQWLKLAINCVINPLTAINDIDNGEVNNTRFVSAITATLNEIVMVAAAEGIILTSDILHKTVTSVAKATAKNSSSMRCDVIANRQTEIYYINGYIHRLGLKHHIATPENTRLWQQIKALCQ